MAAESSAMEPSGGGGGGGGGGGEARMKIRRWDPSTLQPTNTVLLIGKRGSGKSFMMRDLAYHMKDKADLVIGMSPTEEASESLGTFIPPAFIYSDYSEAALKRIMATQKRLWKRGRGPHVAIFLDDCAYDKR
ncbi:MAG: hypothetical protein VYE81_03070 [Planctomycetota bacterium]|nr:hypothetical protein [Planctomycetota bacterium]